MVMSCERADLRPMPDGVMIYGDDERGSIRCRRPTVPRAEVIDELYDAVVRRNAAAARRRMGARDAGSLPRDAGIRARAEARSRSPSGGVPREQRA